MWDRFYSSLSDIYAVDQLSAMSTVTRIWDELPGSIIRICWKNKGKCCKGEVTRDLQTTNVSANTQGAEVVIIEEVRESLQQIVAPETLRRLRIENFSEVAGVDDCAKVMDETDLAVNDAAAMMENI